MNVIQQYIQLGPYNFLYLHLLPVKQVFCVTKRDIQCKNIVIMSAMGGKYKLRRYRFKTIWPEVIDKSCRVVFDTRGPSMLRELTLLICVCKQYTDRNGEKTKCIPK